MGARIEQLEALKQEVPYQWKVQVAREWGCECVPYIDARQVMELLDAVVGPHNWQDDYREVGGATYCTLSINIDGEWVSKSDVGSESAFESEKGLASDAFKRAAVKWGVGRFLYSMTSVRTKSIAVQGRGGEPRYYPADDQGQRIYKLTNYIRSLHKKDLATPQQKRDIQHKMKVLNWEKEDFNAFMKESKATWGTMTRSQAARILKSLEGRMPKKALQAA